MPLAIRRIPGGDAGEWDAVGPYGYGAAFFEGGRADSQFWQAAKEWAISQGIVSVVVRLPVAGTLHAPWPFERHDAGVNVVREVVDWENFWGDVEHKVRKNYKKAVSAGLTFEMLPSAAGIDDFMRLYELTMVRRGVDISSKRTFEAIRGLAEEIPRHSRIAFSTLGKRRISAELLLIEDTTLYSFLGGTDLDFASSRPNDFLKCEIVRWAHIQGLEHYVLGGGLAASQDGIFRYKRSLAPTGVVPFQLGQWIIDSVKYASLVQASGNAAREHLPSYR